jgi:MFS family permease
VVEAYALFLAALLLIGGSLDNYYGRRLVFCLGVTLFALAVLLISFWRVPESRDEEEKNKQLDWLGMGLTTLGLGAVVYGLIESSRLGLAHPFVLAVLVGGALSLAVFLVVEARFWPSSGSPRPGWCRHPWAAPARCGSGSS